MSSRPIVVVTRRLPAAVEAELRRRFDARIPDDDLPTTAEDLQRALGQGDALLTTVTDRVTAEVLAAYPIRTRIIANFGVGYDNIDLAAAQAHDIAVTNTPGVLTDCAADLAMALMMMTMRRTGEGERELRSGQWTGWRPMHMLGVRVTGKTLGLVGMGRVARAVAHRAHHGFGMRIICYDPAPPSPQALAAVGAEPRATLDELLAESDVVSLHCPSTPETRGLMNTARLAQMKRGAFLINAARGEVVDDEALIAALKSGHLAGAGLDVFRGEPNFDRRYLELPNVVLLPHLGSATNETREAMGFKAAENLSAFFEGRPVPDRVI
ncbi:MAG: 2-hydroxyacid dehydrogenase [Gemmatimonadales bacterium]